MTAFSGKRKRRDELNSDDENENPRSEDYGKPDILFRQHFETKFKPLDMQPEICLNDEILEQTSASSDLESVWSSLSNNEASNAEVIDYRESKDIPSNVSKTELRSFMVDLLFFTIPESQLTILLLLKSSKPPIRPNQIKPNAKRKQQEVDSDGGNIDAANLKNDLALQRLLKESHLLEQGSIFAPSGQNRYKAVDLRLQALGSKSSALAQHNMPIMQRKGIFAKALHKEKERRVEAKENGIILERISKKKKITIKRQRNIGGPSVGKFRGGTLRLSKKDVTSIVGRKKTNRGKS
ncbi:MAG: hypothetical protein LQ342_000660 [Letrouitia transgressa]|nr:MAG: hypothetical protein LQ342_000660 [Letrouitia transgressa]